MQVVHLSGDPRNLGKEYESETGQRKANIRCTNDQAIAAVTSSYWLILRASMKQAPQSYTSHKIRGLEYWQVNAYRLSVEGFSIASLILAQLIDYIHVKHSQRKPSGKKKKRIKHWHLETQLKYGEVRRLWIILIITEPTHPCFLMSDCMTLIVH